ncbi:integrase [Brenneria corticis]|uniref:Integrase n=1 Tax=Brenneria corticis TaxID=2173106 RepID=A0A2U1U559_9GAMM|nr:integrase [Brenneria sp. CFCC 11842]PWC16714.1 integrase [Brenneria sp. CFCC 11842]
MPKTLEFIAGHLPRVTEQDVHRFSRTVLIRDAQAFAAELEAFVQERLRAADLPAYIEVPLAAETTKQALARKAVALRTDARWVPGETEIQRGRAAMLAAYEQPYNLSLPRFAELAHKSRQQIYKDIDAGRLLALNVGPRGRKLPDWQLDLVKQKLTQVVLQQAADVDAWTLYHALSEPLEGLAGLSPVEAVTADSVDQVARAVLNVLGLH